MSIEAVNPRNNATVAASAGTGKTWLLVSRMLRLLLAGIRPDSILAITFTKKAAAEMHQRLLLRLKTWAYCNDAELTHELKEIGISGDKNCLQSARQLYEEILISPYPLRIRTFHAFCNDLLAQFPIEAGLPPGFEIIDEAGAQELRDLSWSELMSEAAADSEGQLGQALTNLFQSCGNNTRQALDNFLMHRSDWWAWTESIAEPMEWAKQQLETRFSRTDRHSLIESFFTTKRIAGFKSIAEALSHPEQSGEKIKLSHQLFSALDDKLSSEALFDRITDIILTQSGDIRKLRKASKDTMSKMGEDAVARLEDNWRQLGEICLELMDQIKQSDNYRLNLSWYKAGTRYLETYQEKKLQHRQLDYADQEWLAYQLLNTRDDMLWVQYKLDQRIEHLLVDEFQDTNPTQWRLLLPLLQEFAATAGEKRSAFLVGDEKQSIYAFRRANPELQNVAAHWLETHLGSKRHNLSRSYRSAPAILDVVNQVFLSPQYSEYLPGFSEHSTVKSDYWGSVEILPKFSVEAQNTHKIFRNPLEEPRAESEKSQQAEAKAIAQRIRRLIDEAVLIRDEGSNRPVRYGDIKILLRKRTNSRYIEQALRAEKIPYHGTSLGGLLMAQEVADIQSLLTVLHTPQDNLALARILVSPLFSASQDDLIRLAGLPGGSWFDRLLTLSTTCPQQHPLSYAADYLQRWQQDSQILPLHDLLSKIFFEGDVLDRYHASTETWRHAQIEANLKRLISLALEIDSGRYPSLNHFLMRLNRLQQAGNDAPSEPTPEHLEQPVEILTVHAAKGLEAPVIFLADMGPARENNRPWEAIVDWPASQKRPELMLLKPTARQIDNKTRASLNKWQHKLEREKANLLYVALTRARQMLIISASEPKISTKATDPHAQLLEVLDQLGEFDADGVWVYESGDKPSPAISATNESGFEASAVSLSGLNQPLRNLPPTLSEIAPSYSNDETEAIGTDSSQQRGIGIHVMLDKLTTTDWNEPALCQLLAAGINLAADDPGPSEWYTEASGIIQSHPQLFDSSQYLRAWNELPILYHEDSCKVYGIVDRLIEYTDYVLIVDYKTHRVTTHKEAADNSTKYHQQLGYYQRGIEDLWPAKPVRVALLWTAINYLQFLTIEK